MPGVDWDRDWPGSCKRDVEVTVRPDDHVVHASELVEHLLLVRHLVAADLQPSQLLATERADEQIVLPAGYFVPV